MLTIFKECIGIKTVNLSGCTKLKSISTNVFAGCNIESIDLSSCTSLETIGGLAFKSCKNLKTINLSGCTELRSISDYVFASCEKLTSLDLSNCTRLERIGEDVLFNCTKATVKLPASIKEIRYGAFGGDGDFCKKVLVPNDKVKQLLINIGYPINRIKMYH